MPFDNATLANTPVAPQQHAYRLNRVDFSCPKFDRRRCRRQRRALQRTARCERAAIHLSQERYPGYVGTTAADYNRVRLECESSPALRPHAACEGKTVLTRGGLCGQLHLHNLRNAVR